MPKAADGQYELVLENRQVLTIFFAIVILCGVFFGLGYVVGKNTMGYIPPTETSVAAAAGKKSAIGSEAARQEPAAPQASAPELTYQKTLEEKAPVRLENPPAPTASETKPVAEPAPPPTAPKLVAASNTVAAAAPPAPGSVSLQVAALSKKEDADAFLALLKNKSFPATLVTSAGDRLFRVQVGPFASLKDAEDTKARLEQEGFRTITKK